MLSALLLVDNNNNINNNNKQQQQQQQQQQQLYALRWGAGWRRGHWRSRDEPWSCAMGPARATGERARLVWTGAALGCGSEVLGGGVTWGSGASGEGGVSMYDREA